MGSETPDFGNTKNLRLISGFIGGRILNDILFDGLTPEVLAGLDIFKPGESFADFVASRLALDDSLQGLALERLKRWLPLKDRFSIPALDPTSVLTTQEEDEIRKARLLVGKNPVFTTIELQANFPAFVGRVIDSLGVLETEEGGLSTDPSIANIDEVKGRLLQQDPFVYEDENGKRYFALLVPEILPSTLQDAIGGSFAQTSSLRAYFVVADPQKNHELSLHVLCNRDLLRYFIASGIKEIQAQKLEDLRNLVKGAYIDRFDAAKKEVDVINFEAKAHLLELLHKEASARENIRIIDTSRDSHDVRVLRGEEKPQKYRRGSESRTDVYTVTACEDGSVNFHWFPLLPVVKTEGKTVLVTHETKESNVRVRANKEEKDLEVAVWEEGKELEWKKTKEWFSSVAVYICSFFETIQGLSASSRFRNLDKPLSELTGLVSELKAAQTVGEFFSTLRKCPIYPFREYLIDS